MTRQDHTCVPPSKLSSLCWKSGSEKGVFSGKDYFLEILENLEIQEFLENAQTVENKGDSDHYLEILEKLEIPEISPVKNPFRNDPSFWSRARGC